MKSEERSVERREEEGKEGEKGNMIRGQAGTGESADVLVATARETYSIPHT